MTSAVTATDGEQIAAVLHNAAVLLVRHLSYGQGQSLTSSTVLALLDDEGPARISVLTAAGGVTQPAMTELVARLQREGLVTRLSDPQDARATLVDITTRGRAHRAKLQKSIHDRLVELLDLLPAQSQATLTLAMRVAAPLIDQLTHLASQHPDPLTDRS
jgi:DNA-binding MarR family transcriptional regulator